MDERTFQNELIALKYRVAEMASPCQPSQMLPPTAHAANDAFSHQLDDLKMRLQSMQTSLNQFAAMQNSHNSVRLARESMAENDSFPETQSRLLLPSGPLFWQLFESLRNDVRGLNCRLARTEQSLSDLEDRVDGLEPTQFTPAASEDELIPHPHADSIVTNNMLRHGLQDQLNNHYEPAWSDFHPHSLDCGNPVQASDELREKQTQVELPASGDVMSVQAPQPPAVEGVAFRDREIARLEDLMRVVQDSLRHHENLVRQKDAEIQELNAGWLNSHNKTSELERIIDERSATIRAYTSMCAERDSTIENLRAENESKDETLHVWASRHYSIQQSLMRKKASLCHADRQVEQLQRALYDVQGSKQDALDAKDSEIKKLRDFCEAKDTVSLDQNQIIARGAKIIEERDDEIERMVKQLKVLNDDYQHESRERARFARLLDERDEEIRHLKASHLRSSTPELNKRRIESDQVAKEANMATEPTPTKHVPSSPLSPFATAGSTSKRASPASVQWTPRAIENYARLPWEEERASFWEKSSAKNERHSFGVPGLANPNQRAQNEGKRSGNHRGDLRRSDSLKLLQRLARAGEGAGGGGGRSAPSMIETADMPRRIKLPLEVAARPPLPAPPSPRKMASAGDLLSRRDGGRQQPISRHHSIEHLPGRGLQAYVEEEGREGDV